MVRIFLALSMIFAFAAEAYAYRVKETVPRNRTTLVGHFGGYAKDTCRAAAIPQVKLQRKPEHGKVTFKQITGTLGKDAGRCAGTRVKGIAVYYTPKRGYSGQDRFSAGHKMFRWVGSHQTKYISKTFIITVK